MSRNQVIVLGDACVDMVVRLPDRSGEDLDLTGSVPRLLGGGTAGNVAVALARLGQPVIFCGAVGDDGYGRWLADDFIREGVDPQGLWPVKDAFTAMVMAIVEPDGERLLVVWPPRNGAHHFLPPESIDSLPWENAAWLHTTGMGLRSSPVRETTLQAMELAGERGLMVSLDLNIRKESWGLDAEARAIFERAIKLSNFVLGNAAEEVTLLAGEDSVEEAALKLCDGQRTIIARRGGEGFLVATPQGIVREAAFAVDVVNSLGAGDAFNGGFIAASLQGAGLMEALRWGNGVAAIKISRSEERGFPDRKELLSFLASREVIPDKNSQDNR